MKCHAYFHAVRTLQDIRPLTKMAVPIDFVVRVGTTKAPGAPATEIARR
jgi:hypothetical protein